VEAIDYPARRELDKALVRQLASCRWVEEHQNLLVVGATGTGKTFVGCAFAHQACRKGFRALYRRASHLFHELPLARADGTYLRLLTKLARVHVLLVDDWGLDALSPPPSGTPSSAIPLSPTRSATASSTTPTVSC
jgi:DNA replication protein DnaC